jgi:hypothetical protein
MPEIKEKTTFKAGDGREFKAREEAERYEEMREANEQFNEAVRLYNIALAKTLKTADGCPFRLGDGYYIVWEHAYNDGISHEYLYARDTRVALDEYGRAKVRFVGSCANRDNVVEFELANIYAKELNARLRLLEIRKKRLGWLMEDIAKLERELGIAEEKK